MTKQYLYHHVISTPYSYLI